MKKILIQGAMQEETAYLREQIKKLPDYEKIRVEGIEFEQGRLGDVVVILVESGMGTVKAAMTTACGIMQFHPALVITQGTAGAQRYDLSCGDMVLIDEAVNVNALKMPKKKVGEGCDPFLWTGFHTCCYKADSSTVQKIREQEDIYSAGKVICGRTATGDIYSREDDRIIWLSEKFKTVCEEMETVAVFEVCETFCTPCAGLRVISNNELLDEQFNIETALFLQKYLWKVLPYL